MYSCGPRLHASAPAAAALAPKRRRITRRETSAMLALFSPVAAGAVDGWIDVELASDALTQLAPGGPGRRRPLHVRDLARRPQVRGRVAVAPETPRHGERR